MPKKTASLLPLDYSPRRVEHSVTFGCHGKWSDLLELLTDAKSYFAAQQWQWSSTGPQWELFDDATILIEPAYLHPASLIALSRLLDTTLPSESKLVEDVFREPFHKAVVDVLDLNLVDYEHLKGLSPFGIFYAEFAVKTAMLTVLYVLPSPGTQDDDDNEAPEPAQAQARAKRFKGKVLAPTLGLNTSAPLPPQGGQPTSIKSAPGTLHFDITGGAADRASFIVDWLEQTASLAADLGNHQQLTVGYGEPKEPGQLNRTLPKKPDAPAKFAPEPGHPRVIVENATPMTPMCVCGTVPVRPLSDGFLLGTLSLKDYPILPCVPPPIGP